MIWQSIARFDGFCTFHVGSGTAVGMNVQPTALISRLIFKARHDEGRSPRRGRNEPCFPFTQAGVHLEQETPSLAFGIFETEGPPCPARRTRSCDFIGCVLWLLVVLSPLRVVDNCFSRKDRLLDPTDQDLRHSIPLRTFMRITPSPPSTRPCRTRLASGEGPIRRQSVQDDGSISAASDLNAPSHSAALRDIAARNHPND